jgi:very-short-patch-repair endonuclease
LSEQELEVALEHALRERMTTVRRLRWRLDELGTNGRPGTGALRCVLGSRRTATTPTESTLETLFAGVLRGAGAPAPERQFVIRDGAGFVARMDFAYPDCRVGIEVTGHRFHSGRRAWARDIERNNRLTALGWRILYVTWDRLVDRPDEVTSS